jgi:hypothetical protein
MAASACMRLALSGVVVAVVVFVVLPVPCIPLGEKQNGPRIIPSSARPISLSRTDRQLIIISNHY